MEKLPIGISDFKQVKEEGYYYVDKSLFIKEVLDNVKIILLTRPRRFGKTINLSLLRYFFEKANTDTSYLFKDLKIWKEGGPYTRHQGQYPVIFLTFKGVKEDNWEKTYEWFRNIIAEEFKDHSYLLKNNFLTGDEKTLFKKIINRNASELEYKNSLRTLSAFLYRYHQQRVVILIDEYDTPVNASYLNGFYEQTTPFMRSLFEGAYKDNEYLEKGVITGILRVAKEGFFSGLNNLKAYSVLSHPFADKFGFTEAEVIQMLEDYGVKEALPTIQAWYNGYVVGNQAVIYNPWSILNYVDTREDGLRPHWVNTSDNALIQELIVDDEFKNRKRLLELIDGQGFVMRPSETMIFPGLRGDETAVWTLLLYGGYLNAINRRRDDNDEFFYLRYDDTQ
ncbi:MAG: AAA family ATPase [Bacteroidia bacterium]|nr:AAA family ATPase [Bacteroidia bacterium]